MSIIGKVDGLWRYPVKSMQGEELDEVFMGIKPPASGNRRPLKTLPPRLPEHGRIGFATRKSHGQGAAWNVTVSGDRAFSAIPDNGLRQVDVKDPGKAETLSIYRKLHAPVAVVVKGRHAFVADQSAGLRLIDVSQKRMREVGRLAFDDSVINVALAGSRLLLALKTGGLAVVDVSHPATPRLVALPGSSRH